MRAGGHGTVIFSSRMGVHMSATRTTIAPSLKSSMISQWEVTGFCTGAALLYELL